MKMKIGFFLIAAALVVGAIWSSSPSSKPPHDCGNILASASHADCDFTKGNSK
jgi:hypothetical protein